MLLNNSADLATIDWSITIPLQRSGGAGQRCRRVREVIGTPEANQSQTGLIFSEVEATFCKANEPVETFSPARFPFHGIQSTTILTR